MLHYVFMRKQFWDEAGTDMNSSFWCYHAPFNYDACLRPRAHTVIVIVTQACRHLVATLHHEPEHCKTVIQRLCLDLQLSLERQSIILLHGALLPLAVAIS